MEFYLKKIQNVILGFFYNLMFISHACTNRTIKAAVKLWIPLLSHSELLRDATSGVRKRISVLRRSWSGPVAALPRACRVQDSCKDTCSGVDPRVGVASAPLPTLTSQELNWDPVPFLTFVSDVKWFYNNQNVHVFIIFTPESPLAGCSDCLFHLIF